MRSPAKPGRFTCPGSRKLDALIRERGLTTDAAGEEIFQASPADDHVLRREPRYARGTVHGWRNGQIRPDNFSKARIALWSRDRDPETGECGEPRITLDDWLLDHERQTFAALQVA